MAVFDVLSRRDQPIPDVYTYDEVPEKLRAQILWLWNEYVPHGRDYDFCRFVQEALCREHGRSTLMKCQSPMDDLRRFMKESDDHAMVLDAIELSFGFLGVLLEEACDTQRYQNATDELNFRFRQNGIGYEFNRQTRKLIPINNSVLHEEVVQPMLRIVNDPQFDSANSEIMGAFDDYKKGRFEDCLTKCGAALESTMKIVFAERNWSHDSRATAGPLVKLLIDRTGLPTFLEQPLMIVATLRNRLSTSHGAGTMTRDVPEHLAKYALHATSSMIVLVYDSAQS